MKIKHVLMIAAVLLAMLAVPAAAETVVTYSVGDTYKVIIPESLTVDTDGLIGVSGLLDANTQVRFSVDSANAWELKLGNKDSLSYKLYKAGTEEISSDVLTVNAEDIADSSKNRTSVIAKLTDNTGPKYRGDYTDVLTFTVTHEADSTTHSGYDLIRSYAELYNLITTGGKGLLINNIEFDENTGLEIGSNIEVTLDLNGYTISGSNDATTTSYLIKNNGILTLNGPGYVTFTASNPSTNNGYGSNTISNYGTLTINSGVIVTGEDDGGATYAVDHYDGKFTLNGGTLLDKGTALRVVTFGGNPEFIMEDGLIKGKVAGIIHIQTDSYTSVKVTVNGGTMQATEDLGEYLFYTYSFGKKYSGVDFTITNGNFIDGIVSIGYGYYNDEPTYSISGGTFDYEVLKWTVDGAEVVYPQPQNP